MELAELSNDELIALEEKLDLEIASADLRQKAVKVSMNSLYGVVGNGYFRFFDVDNAEAVTITGQLIIQYISRELDKYLNELFGTTNYEYVIYCDTDSVYVRLEEFVNKYFAGKPPEFITKKVDKLCKDKIEKAIERICEEIVSKVLNGVQGHLSMKREAIGDKGIWTAKKRYLVNVRDMEGVVYAEPKIKYIGVALATATTPKFCRDRMLEAIKILMKGDQDKLIEYIEEQRLEFNKLAPEDIASPRTCNGIEKYSDASTVFKPRCPFHTKGAIIYNYLVRKMGLESKLQYIREGEKIKYLYLIEPNPTPDRAIAFLNTLPKEFGLHQYIDYDTMWSKGFIEPLNLILEPIGWRSEKVASLDWMFE